MEKNASKNTHDEFDLKKAFFRYLKQWKWFVLSCIVFIILAFFNLRYEEPEFNAYSKIMLMHDEGVANSAETILKDLGQISASGEKVIDDEIEVLKSRNLMMGVVEKLDLNITFYAQGRVYETPFYPNRKAPIKVNFLASDSILNKSSFKFSVRITSDTTFDYLYGADEIGVKTAFGENISTRIGDIIVTPNAKNDKNLKSLIEEGLIISVKLTPVELVAEDYRNAVDITSAGEFSKVINLSLNNSSPWRAMAVLNTLVDEYNRTSVEEKSIKSNNAADFIDKRISLISTDLAKADDEIQQFKTSSKLTDITSEADIYLNTNAQTEQELANSRTEFNKVNYLLKEVGDNSLERIPSNIGSVDGSLNAMVSRYNELLNNRDRLLKSSNEKNPIIVNLDQQLNNLKNNLQQSLKSTAETLSLRMRSLENQSAKISSKIYAIPGQTRQYRDSQREQGIKESLYLYLLQKREEATISSISTSPNAKIIDKAHSLFFPVSPNIKMTYILAVLVGLCIPFGFFYVKDLLDNKIHNKEDLEKVIRNITVLGEIPRIERGDSGLIESNDRSILSESFRIIRTNFDYIKRRKSVEKYNNVIFVTSTVNGEGKSFFSLNMALTLANTGKKVLLLGADVRNPQIYSAINKEKKNKQQQQQKQPKIGLSEYLSDGSIVMADAINEYDINNIKIDILMSGRVPPNPAELLMNDKIGDLFDKVSNQYDYVVVDTAPSMLVTDTLLISEYAGHTIYLTRADHTEKKILNFAKELHEENKLKGMMLVVNDVKQSNFGYGARYGYYGAPEKKSWFRRKKKATA